MSQLKKSQKKNLLPIDELNAFEYFVRGDAESNDSAKATRSTDDIIDEMLDLLLLAIARGEASANDDLGTDVSLETDSVKAIVNKEIAGKTWKERVSEYADGGQVAEIIRVAETETMRSFNEASLETANQSEAKFSKRWLTMEDERVRDTHSFLDLVEVAQDEKFYTTDGDSALCPGGFSLPENNVNCRCVLQYVRD